MNNIMNKIIIIYNSYKCNIVLEVILINITHKRRVRMLLIKYVAWD